MPVHAYSVLKGRPINYRLGTSQTKHYQILVSANGELHRVAVNVRSSDGSDVEFLVRPSFDHPLTALWQRLPEGLTALPPDPGGAALDYIRDNIAQPWEFVPLPLAAAGPDNDLNEKLDAYVQRAMADESAMIYAFGATWGPEPDKADKYFGFLPGRGVHDIHMNQGNPPGPFAGDNGPRQDGALVFEFAGSWVAVLLKFQTQAWHSDDVTATPILPRDPDYPDRPHTPISVDAIPSLEVPDGLVRIVAACVNDTASPERETVTLLNSSDRSIDLAGWHLKDKLKNAMALDGSIAAGETLRVVVKPPLALSNKGGIISLLDARGIKVHGVAYTRDQARHPGRTLVF